MKIDEVAYKGLKFKYRHDTTDWGIIKEACGGLNIRFFDVKSGETWFDIGAHIGAFTCYAASKGATVWAFEPMPDNYNLLIENIKLNCFSTEYDIMPINAALGKEEKTIQLFVDRQNYGNCSIYDRGNVEHISVRQLPASLLNKHNDFCIKIDTEGCEYSILSEIDLSKVKKLILENHYWLQPKEETAGILNLIHTYFNHQEEHGGYMLYAWK